MNKILKYIIFALVIIALVIVAIFAFKFGKNSRNSEVAELVLKLAQSEKTIEIQKQVFATNVFELSGLQKLLDTSRDEVKLLKKQLDDSQAKILATQEIAIKWKKAYEGALNSTQTTEPPIEPGSPQREKVTFSGLLGPIQVDGYTLTYPAESYVSIKQIKPVILTVVVAKNVDGTWSSYTTSSDDNLDIKVNLGGVDIGAVVKKSWKDNIWLNAGVDVLGTRSAYVGMSYSFNKFSLGLHCGTDESCGFDLGFKVFK